MTTQHDVDQVVGEAIDLLGLLVERATHEPDPVGYLRAQVERLRLELAYLAPSSATEGGGPGG